MVSLKTGTHREAEKLRDIQLALIQAEFDREINELRAAGTKPLIEATDEHLAMLRERFFYEELTAIHYQQARAPAAPKRTPYTRSSWRHSKGAGPEILYR
jgi:hypothetical protein